MSVRAFFKTIGVAAEKNAPTILMVTGIGGSITALVLGIQGTSKAHELLEEKKAQKVEQAESRGEVPEELTVKEEAGVALRAYWPALVTEAGAILCFLLANRIHIRRGAAVAALYKASEETFRMYQGKVRDRLGEKEEHEVHRAVNQEKIERAVAERKVQETGHGTVCFYDPWSGRLFRSDIEYLRHAQNAFNKRLLNEGDLCLNDWYDEIDLENTESGYRLGWNCDCLADQVELSFEAHQLGDGTYITAVQFEAKPDYDFRVSHYRR